MNLLGQHEILESPYSLKAHEEVAEQSLLWSTQNIEENTSSSSIFKDNQWFRRV